MRRKNNFYILVAVLMLIVISVGYAALTARLTINGKGDIRENTWDIHFENVKVIKDIVGTEVPVINDKKDTTTYSVTMSEPGQVYEFNVDIVNKGTIDGMVNTVVIDPLTDSQKKYLEYSVTYLDGTPISPKDLYVAGTGKQTVKVYLKFKDDIQVSDLPTEEVTLDLSVTVNFVQADSTAKEVEVSTPTLNTYTLVNDINSNGVVETGDEIAIGDEHFYVISNTNGTISALAKYNLNVGEFALSTETSNIQSDLVVGYIPGSTLKYGIVPFSNNTGWTYANNATIDIKQYNGPVKDALYGENGYEKYIQQIIPDATVRLITYKELSDLGCVAADYTCSGAPSWVYSASYWTASALYDDPNYVWYVQGDGEYWDAMYYDSSSFGVRPVVVISE